MTVKVPAPDKPDQVNGHRASPMRDRPPRLTRPGPGARMQALVIALCLCIAQPLAAKAESTVTIIALGDSLTAGFGLAPGQAFAEALEAALQERGHPVTIVNAGVSGDTATSGMARLEWSVPDNADGVIVELGANDALRGLDPAITRKALVEIIDRLQARGQVVLLAGMRAPVNMGPDYGSEFDAIYSELSSRAGVLFYPFFLEGVAADPKLNQPDGIHPNEEGVRIIVENMMPEVERMIQIILARR